MSSKASKLDLYEINHLTLNNDLSSFCKIKSCKAELIVPRYLVFFNLCTQNFYAKQKFYAKTNKSFTSTLNKYSWILYAFVGICWHLWQGSWSLSCYVWRGVGILSFLRLGMKVVCDNFSHEILWSFQGDHDFKI